MSAIEILLTGFGPFLDVELNPSGELASALDGRELAGARVRSTILPVTFGGVGPALDAALESLFDVPPAALLSMGVQREAWFRVERRARPELGSNQLDGDGLRGAEVGPLGEREFVTGLELEPLVEALRRGGAGEAGISDDAGGYVCECTYHALLERAERLGVPALFLHVPPVQAVPVEQQLSPVSALIEELVRQTAAQ